MDRVGSIRDVTLPRLSLLAITRDVPLSEMSGAVAPIFEKLTDAVRKAGFAFFGPSIALYQMKGDAMRCVVGVDLSGEIDGLERVTVPETRALVGRYVLGPADFITAHEEMIAEVAARNLKIGGWGREVYLGMHGHTGAFECDIIADIAG